MTRAAQIFASGETFPAIQSPVSPQEFEARAQGVHSEIELWQLFNSRVGCPDCGKGPAFLDTVMVHLHNTHGWEREAVIEFALKHQEKISQLPRRDGEYPK